MRTALLLCSCVAVVLAGCGETSPEAGPPPEAGPERAADAAGPWRVDVAFEHDTKVGGCAIGDADPDRPGLEIVAVDLRGDVHLLFRDGDGWGHEVIARTGGEKIQCAAGVLGGSPAIAVVGVAEGKEDDGGAGEVVVIRKDEGVWQDRVLEQPFATLVHGVAIGPLDEDDREGTLAVTGFDKMVFLFDATPWSWSSEVLFGRALQAPGKAVAIGHGAVWVAQAGERLEWIEAAVERERDAEGVLSSVNHAWTLRDRAFAPTSQARIGLAPDGSALAIAADDGKLRWLRLDGDPVTAPLVVVHEEARKLRGAAIGDFAPDTEGWELASAGYEGKVTVLVGDGQGGFEPHVVYEDDRKLHHLASGDLLPDVPGDELVTCGYSGRVVVIRRRGAASPPAGGR